MAKVVTFGELMLRLNPEGYLMIRQAGSFLASFAGGEANVAVSAANYGLKASFVTKLPQNDLAQAALSSLRANAVDVSDIVYGGERMGIYFVEKGASQRPSKVLYDRKHSAVSQAARQDFDWNSILEGADWFHFTGITPALGGSLPEICLDAVKTARGKGVRVSCDLNYRKNLWTPEQAKAVMSGLMPYVDVCIANEEDAEMVLGIKPEGADVARGELSDDAYAAAAQRICAEYGCAAAAFTLRRSITASDNNWAGMLYKDGHSYFSPNYHIHIVDRVGGGDSFAGALIYAMISGFSGTDAITFAVAASCLKHTIEYDFNKVTADEVWKLAKGDSTGRVQR